GPVRLALQVTNGHVTRLRSYVGGHWKPAAGVTALGTVAAPEAARFLLDLARTGTGRAAEEAIVPAALADSVAVWPDLLQLAGGNKDPVVRRKAICWLGQSNDPRAINLFEELLTRP